MHQHKFEEAFDHNKKALGNNTMPSKKMRNKIAGYISRLKRMERESVVKAEKAKAKAEMLKAQGQMQQEEMQYAQ